ncbi:hypothetical protein [Ruminococcus sp. CAG:330]|uniref:hypothetical protein n=1 Tax=Ruminococcus sp. CAG:330 TaxID=1262954 RepID=UPI000334E930|nr:hypothetical protein [Ruminococcus sp. CAG:330]CDE12597.1 transcriptional regulator AraC family [Ruminococcus sp. CAG:330]
MKRLLFGVIAAQIADTEQKQLLQGILTQAQTISANVAVFSNIYNPKELCTVSYFSPLFFAKRTMRYVVLSYNGVFTYEPIFRNWAKTVSNGLEFLRMKTDIQYYIACQNISDTYDSVTGLYHETGFRSQLKQVLSASRNSTLMFGILRARVHRRLSTSFRQILLHTALKILAIRKYACKFLPCLQKNLLENPHIFPMNTSSEIRHISKWFLLQTAGKNRTRCCSSCEASSKAVSSGDLRVFSKRKIRHSASRHSSAGC